MDTNESAELSGRTNQSSFDGALSSAEVEFDFGALAKTENDQERTLELTFDMGRVGPIELRTDPTSKITRTAFNKWEVDIDSINSHAGPNALRLRWIAPIDRVTLLEAQLLDRPPTPETDEFSLYREYLGRLERLSNTGSTNERFWLTLDLATSFDAIQDDLADVAAQFGGSVDDYDDLDAINVEGLRYFLESRWRLRATLHSCGLDAGLLLQQPSGYQEIAERVARLTLQVIKHHFGGSAEHFDAGALWDAVVGFACGCFRHPNSGEKLNLEPNSATFASFAELFDFAADQEWTGLNTADYAACGMLRTIFASALEPYFEIYRSHKRRPRQSQLYSNRNLPDDLVGCSERRSNANVTRRDPRWDSRRRRALIRKYRAAADPGLIEKSLPWLRDQWGRTLAEAIADERPVRRARRAPDLPT